MNIIINYQFDHWCPGSDTPLSTLTKHGIHQAHAKSYEAVFWKLSLVLKWQGAKQSLIL